MLLKGFNKRVIILKENLGRRGRVNGTRTGLWKNRRLSEIQAMVVVGWVRLGLMGWDKYEHI